MKRDLRRIASSDSVPSFDEARIVVAYKQAAVRSKGEARQALAGMDLDGLSVKDVEALALQLANLGAKERDDDDE